MKNMDNKLKIELHFFDKMLKYNFTNIYVGDTHYPIRFFYEYNDEYENEMVSFHLFIGDDIAYTFDYKDYPLDINNYEYDKVIVMKQFFEFRKNVINGELVYQKIVGKFMPKELIDMPEFQELMEYEHKATSNKPIHECPVCFDKFASSTPCCSNNHFICCLCKSHMNKRNCPICRSSFI